MATKTTKKIQKTVDTVAEEAVVKDVVEVTEPTPAPKKEVRKFADTDTIPCISITAGRLGMIGIKSHINYSWEAQGEVVDVEYQDLAAAVRSGKKHITEPYFIIDDEDFLKQFPQVQKIYNTIYDIEDLKNVLKMSPAQIKKVVPTLPPGARESIKSIVADAIQHGTLDSVQRIKAFDEIFDTKFMLMTELFG